MLITLSSFSIVKGQKPKLFYSRNCCRSDENRRNLHPIQLDCTIKNIFHKKILLYLEERGHIYTESTEDIKLGQTNSFLQIFDLSGTR